MQLVPPGRWRHVRSQDNPADCASCGLFPSELLTHKLWWNAPDWLRLPSANWPNQPSLPTESLVEEQDICLKAVIDNPEPVLPLKWFSSLLCVKSGTEWIYRFIENSCKETDTRCSTCRLLSWWCLKPTGSRSTTSICQQDWNSQEQCCTFQIVCLLYILFLIRLVLSELVVGVGILNYPILLSIQLYCQANIRSLPFLSAQSTVDWRTWGQHFSWHHLIVVTTSPVAVRLSVQSPLVVSSVNAVQPDPNHN